DEEALTLLIARLRAKALRLRHGARARCPIGARPSPRPSCTAPAAGEPGGRPCLAVPPLDTSVPEASVGGGERGGDVRRRRHSQSKRFRRGSRRTMAAQPRGVAPSGAALRADGGPLGGHAGTPRRGPAASARVRPGRGQRSSRGGPTAS
ncbi:unnamed protein product, partial [Prorocentrum cordatum]